MFKGINISGVEVVGQLIVVGDTACIVPLNDPNDWRKDYLTFDGHHLRQAELSAVKAIIKMFRSK